MEELEINKDKFICPTCKKKQEWNTTCKLCGSDISQMQNLASNYLRLQRNLRKNLQSGNWRNAEYIAQQLTFIAPTPLNKKILKFLKSHIFN
ncbi:MAG: hypothetical protein LBE18_02385 [Planctomycetaceae bacterium]|jgi:hypothetical protein|nr:hypothetical protein [Planctomycetaceae bacterium]